jgi:hypothetical protein
LLLGLNVTAKATQSSKRKEKRQDWKEKAIRKRLIFPHFYSPLQTFISEYFLARLRDKHHIYITPHIWKFGNRYRDGFVVSLEHAVSLTKCSNPAKGCLPANGRDWFTHEYEASCRSDQFAHGSVTHQASALRDAEICQALKQSKPWPPLLHQPLGLANCE